MTTRDLQKILSDPPKLHQDDDGKMISSWRIDDQLIEELNKRLVLGMRTVETGAGLSTILFAANGCRHTCLVPDQQLVNRIQEYCKQTGVDQSSTEFVVAPSRSAVPQLIQETYDLALIDGLHGFPTAYVDFCYMTLALRKGGALVVDDMHIHTCREIAAFMESDGAWRVEILTSRFALGIKNDENGGIDGGWGQPFVYKRSVVGDNRLPELIEASGSYPAAYERELVPSPAVMKAEGVETLEEWFRWGEEWAMALKVCGGMQSTSRVLELGCGLGRIALPLRFQLLNGKYDGCDAYPFKIEFLRRRFQPAYSNFRFHDSRSLNAAPFRLPFRDGAFDCVFSASAFTYMLPEEARKYLQEMSRIVYSKGRVVIGAFVLDHFKRGRRRPLGFSRPAFDFQYRPKAENVYSFAVAQRDQQEGMIAYTQETLLRFAAEAGLVLAEPVKPGMWSGVTDQFLLGEDLLILRPEK